MKGRRELRRSETRHMKASSGGIRIWSGTLIHPPGFGTEGEVSPGFGCTSPSSVTSWVGAWYGAVASGGRSMWRDVELSPGARTEPPCLSHLWHSSRCSPLAIRATAFCCSRFQLSQMALRSDKTRHDLNRTKSCCKSIGQSASRRCRNGVLCVCVAGSCSNASSVSIPFRGCETSEDDCSDASCCCGGAPIIRGVGVLVRSGGK